MNRSDCYQTALISSQIGTIRRNTELAIVSWQALTVLDVYGLTRISACEGNVVPRNDGLQCMYKNGFRLWCDYHLTSLCLKLEYLLNSVIHY